MPLLFSFPLPGRAATVKACLDFRTSGLSAAQQTKIFDKAKSKYGFADPNDVSFCSVSDPNTACPVGAKVITFDPAQGKVWGLADKDCMTAQVFVGLNADELKVFTTDDKRGNLFGETAAHELGHLLCAGHNWDKKPNTLMTEGSKVKNDVRAADARAFTDADKTTIKGAIAMLKAGKSWKTKAGEGQARREVRRRRRAQGNQEVRGPCGRLLGEDGSSSPAVRARLPERGR